MEQKQPLIDFSVIKEGDLAGLCSALIKAVKEYYKDPENVRKFETWKKAQNAKQNQYILFWRNRKCLP